MSKFAPRCLTKGLAHGLGTTTMSAFRDLYRCRIADMINAIPQEHKRGRRLFIGTMNMDAGRGMIWNIGAIAASNNPDRVKLIHNVLQASSAIPVAFPPIIIPVEANGQTYDEMDVDGGAASQVSYIRP